MHRVEVLVEEHTARANAMLADLQRQVTELTDLARGAELEHRRYVAWVAYALLAPNAIETRARLVCLNLLPAGSWPTGFAPVEARS